MRMRKKRHGSERLLALSSLLYPKCDENWISSADVYKNDRPLKLEVGCGKGEFITKLSLRDTEFNYIALERISDVAVCAVEKYASSRGLGNLGANGGWLNPDGELYKDGNIWDIPHDLRGNVRFIVDDANNVVSKIPDNTLAEIIANFSDPWARKCKQEKRRLTNPTLLEHYRRILKEDGVFSFKTDNDDLFDYTVEMLPGCGFEIVYMTRDLHNSEIAESNIVTEYENNFSSKGINIKMLRAKPNKNYVAEFVE
ncbi:MAG: tRNA (guanosine(46)-N7)-methyltransferase TrmB [Ruminococcaceae bacterium]|nr:tRNA (guanosine(46)-N7)-methyltransferase TrmB [Oscillospiraceae bacterium]